MGPASISLFGTRKNFQHNHLGDDYVIKVENFQIAAKNTSVIVFSLVIHVGE
jgi:hypothetical protein